MTDIAQGLTETMREYAAIKRRSDANVARLKQFALDYDCPTTRQDAAILALIEEILPIVQAYHAPTLITQRKLSDEDFARIVREVVAMTKEGA